MENKEIDEKDLEKILYCYWDNITERRFPRTYFDDKTILFEDKNCLIAMKPQGERTIIWHPKPIVYTKKSLKDILS